MGFFKSWGKSLAYPYIYLGRTLGKSAKTLKGELGTVKNTFTRLKQEADQVNAIQDEEHNGKAAFKEKFIESGWTLESLEKRRLSIVKNKWICRFLCVFFGASGIWCFFAFPGFWGAITGIALLFAMTFYILRTFLACLYIAQIQEKNLMTAKHFFSRPDVFARVLFK